MEIKTCKSRKIIPIQFRFILIGFVLIIASWSVNIRAAELQIGTATIDISPKLPVALQGQFHMRIAKTAETPLTANVIAMESLEDGKSLDMAIMVSCDLISIPTDLLALVREEVHQLLPGLDVNKIFINGTHTHTAPVLVNGQYPIPKDTVTQVVCPNQFELFTDYGLRIQARSKALQTFIIQCAGPGTYLPTEKAVRGGGYSAVVQSSMAGPEGGQILVDRTVELINSLWPDIK